MSIKKKIRNKLFCTLKGQVFFYKIRVIREKIAIKTLSDYKYIQKIYKKRFGNDINLKKPQTFQEKLQWMKLFYRDDVIPICSDKAKLHNYLADIGLGYLSNDIIGVYKSAEEINFDSLPTKFVAKANHGSGWNLICENKDELNWEDTKKLMNSWLKLNLYVFGREWNYKNIEPRIVIEKYLDYKPLNDYKFMCYNGKPLYMQMNNDRDGIHYVDFYELENWKILPVTYGTYTSSGNPIEKPKQYDEMYALAEKLSKPFPFVRVDFYNFNDVVILGELTFFPGGGLWPFVPRNEGVKYDLLLGEPLILPKANNNLDLLKKIE